MKALLLSLVVAGLAVGGVAAAAIGGSSSAAKGSQTFVDPTGDSVDDAPDIAQVDVSNEDNGDVSIVVSIANRPLGFEADDTVYVFLDTDSSPGTGKDGFDYLYAAASGFTALYRWNGSSYGQTPAPTASGSVSNTGQVSLRINRSDLGNSAAFGLVVLSNGAEDSAVDRAPDTGAYHYELGLPSATTTTAGTTTTTTPTTTTEPLPPAPAPRFLVTPLGKPHAGKRFTVRVQVVLAGRSLAPTSLGCSASVGRAKARAIAGRQACVVSVPAGTAGKTLVVAFKLHFRAVARTSTLRIRIV
jgi:hypothetical protein